MNMTSSAISPTTWRVMPSQGLRLPEPKGQPCGQSSVELRLRYLDAAASTMQPVLKLPTNRRLEGVCWGTLSMSI
jgi:hypothetical protein